MKITSSNPRKTAYLIRVYQHDHPSLLSRASSGSPFNIEKPTLHKGWITVFLLTLSKISADSGNSDPKAIRCIPHMILNSINSCEADS